MFALTYTMNASNNHPLSRWITNGSVPLAASTVVPPVLPECNPNPCGLISCRTSSLSALTSDIGLLSPLSTLSTIFLIRIPSRVSSVVPSYLRHTMTSTSPATPLIHALARRLSRTALFLSRFLFDSWNLTSTLSASHFITPDSCWSPLKKAASLLLRRFTFWNSHPSSAKTSDALDIDRYENVISIHTILSPTLHYVVFKGLKFWLGWTRPLNERSLGGVLWGLLREVRR